MRNSKMYQIYFNYYYNYITNKYLVIVKFIGFSLPILMKLGLLG